MQISSCTAVFASATILVAGAAFGQNSPSAVSTQTANFYVTTPQTGEQVAVGQPAQSQHRAQPSQAVSQNQRTGAGGALAASASGGIVANTYLSQTRMPAITSSQQTQTVVSASSRQIQNRRNSAPHSSPVQTTSNGQSYTIQQVSNPAGALGSSQIYANNQSGSRALSPQNSSSVVSTSAQRSNFYAAPAQAVAAAQPAATPKRGLFSRLVHSHPKTPPAVPVAKSQKPATDWAKYKPSRLAHSMQEGMASWYGKDFHGGKTANGERYDMNSMTAAHKTLPFGTMVKVKNERNGRECVVRINNRGPFSKGRIIDLSKAAASELGMVSSGIARVSCEVIGRS